MKLKTLAMAMGLLLVFGAASSQAALFTFDFTNTLVDLGTNSQIDITNQYHNYGLDFSNAYRYIDARDPFADQFGMSNGIAENNTLPAQTGLLHFTHDTQTFLSIDCWTIEPDQITFDAYDENMNFLGSSSALSVPTGTTINYNGPALSFLDWHDSGGRVQIANITYDLTPEPGTLSLLGIGLVGLGGLRRKLRK
jgi:hypothetical protein